MQTKVQNGCPVFCVMKANEGKNDAKPTNNFLVISCFFGITLATRFNL